MFIDKNCFLKSAMWPMGLLFICHYVIGCFIFRGKDFRASITVLMTASSYCFSLRCKLIRGFIFVQMKGHALFLGEIIIKKIAKIAKMH